MAHWTDLLDDARAIRAIFGDAPPSLRGVDLHEVVVSWDGPSVSLRLDIAEFPPSPPSKWAKFNTVHLSLGAVGVEALTMSDVLPRRDPVDLDIRREPLPASQTLRNQGVQYTSTGPVTPERPRSLIHVDVLVGPDPILEVTTHWLYLEKISAYLSTERPEQ